MTLTIPNEIFDKLYNLDVSAYVEKRQGLSYLSWSYALKILREHLPGYVVRLEECVPGVPFFGLEDGGAYVLPYLESAEGQRTPYLFFPVYDYRFKAQLEFTVADINNAIQRATVKAIAVNTGLGLKLYTGEDLPNGNEPEPVQQTTTKASRFSATRKPY